MKTTPDHSILWFGVGCFLWLLGVAMVALVLSSLTGCVSHQWPKDAMVIDGSSKVSTPWGTGEITAKEIRTGKAAIPAK